MFVGGPHARGDPGAGGDALGVDVETGKRRIQSANAKSKVCARSCCSPALAHSLVSQRVCDRTGVVFKQLNCPAPPAQCTRALSRRRQSPDDHAADQRIVLAAN